MKEDVKVDPYLGEIARSLDDEERQEAAMVAAVTSPVGLLLGVVSSVVSVVQGIAVFLLPFAIIATLIGFLDWSDLRVVLAWVVAGWILLRGAGLALIPYGMLISRLNRNAIIIETPYGEERLVGWSARPLLGFVVVLPFVAVAYVIASLAFHWIIPGP